MRKARKYSVKYAHFLVYLPYNSACGLEIFREMQKYKNSGKKAEVPLDTFSTKRERGRPRKCRYPEIIGRADNYGMIFTEIWLRLSGPLLASRNEDEVREIFEAHGQPYAQEFVPRLAQDILKVIGDRKFPRRAKAQIKFLANSLAGRPNVEHRTSRDICAQELAKDKARSPYRILRKEFYVECSCGFKGPALNDACRKCRAQISTLPELFPGAGPV